MNIVCVICSDTVAPSDDVCSTPCGHIFHLVCLTQWLERSKTCPQCRTRINKSIIHRVYFNFPNNDTIVDDTSTLLDRIDKLSYQLRLKDNENKNYTEKNGTLEKQNAELRKEVRKVETELNVKNSAIHALKEQAKYLKVQCTEVDNTKKELETLKKKVNEYRHIQVLLNGSAEEVDEMLSTRCDPATLVTYISVMKREMTTSFQRSRELRSRLTSLQQELTKVSMDRNFLSAEREKRKKLEEQLMTCESEKMFFENELRELTKRRKEKPQEKINFRVEEADRTELEKVESDLRKKRKTEIVVDNSSHEQKETPVERKREYSNIDWSQDDNLQSHSVSATGVCPLYQILNQPSSSTERSSSILFKKSRIGNLKHYQATREANTYDGLGGHSKHDVFPVSSSSTQTKKLKVCAAKSKKQKLNTGNNEKLDRHFNII